MSENVFFNPGPDSVVIDGPGHILDAQERTTASPRNAIISRLVAGGQLVDLGPVEDQPTPDPWAESAEEPAAEAEGKK